MKGVPRPIRLALDAEVRRWGGEVSFIRANKHPIFEVRYGGQHRRHAMAGSPKIDEKAQLNSVLQDARAMLKSMGAPPPDGERDAPCKKAHHRNRRPPPRPVRIAPHELGDPRVGGLGDLDQVILALAAQRLRRWSGLKTMESKRTEAALALLEAWHPTTIRDAAKLIEQALEIGHAQQSREADRGGETPDQRRRAGG